MDTSNDAVSLVPASEADHEWLFELKYQSMGPYIEAIWGWDPAVQRGYFERFLLAGDVQIIKQGEIPVGVVQVHDHDDHIYIAEIEVASAHQGHGIGGGIVRQIQQRARLNKQPVLLQVLKNNPRARALYSRLGFEATGDTETHILMRWSTD